jgi:glycosyltransferase involved in cell wall biosynthesis
MLDMPGYGDRQEFPEHLSRAHVFAAPSRYEGGPGFVYLEAMACGLPVIACRGSGSSEVIQDNQTGLLVPPDDVPALANALRQLLHDRNRREKMGASALEYVEKEANSRDCVARIETFYRSVIAASGTSPGE